MHVFPLLHIDVHVCCFNIRFLRAVHSHSKPSATHSLPHTAVQNYRIRNLLPYILCPILLSKSTVCNHMPSCWINEYEIYSYPFWSTCLCWRCSDRSLRLLLNVSSLRKFHILSSSWCMRLVVSVIYMNIFHANPHSEIVLHAQRLFYLFCDLISRWRGSTHV